MSDLSTFLRQSSFTYSDIQRDCYSYIDSLPEGSKPKDFFKGSEGRIIVDYLSAFHADIAYKIIVGYCESYLLYANKIENIIANAESKGYNCQRGTNATFTLTFMPTDTVNIAYLDQVATLGDYGIYATEAVQAIAGTPTTIQCVIGNLKTAEVVVDDPTALIYRFRTANVSSHIKLLIDQELVSNLSTDPMQALYGSLVAMTNSYGSVDILDFRSIEKLAKESYHYELNGIEQTVYLTGTEAPYTIYDANSNVIATDGKISSEGILSFTYNGIKYFSTDSINTLQINAGSILTLQYIELENMSYTEALGSFQLGTVMSFVQSSTYEPSETAVSIQKNAILHSQTQNRAVARRDFKKLTKLFVPGMINTNDYDYSPARIAVTYVLRTGLPMTQTQLTQLLAYLSDCRVFGIPMPYIVNSFALNTTLQVQLTTSTILSTSYIQTQISNILSNYNYTCGVTLNFAELEADVEALEGVEVARFMPVATPYTGGSPMPLGTVIIPGNGNAYIAAAYLYRSGTTEPAWPTVLGETVTDGQLVWTCIKPETVASWEDDTSYQLYQAVTPTVPNGFAYQVTQILNYSGTTEPTGAGLDGSIVWSEVTYNSTAPTWQANTVYAYGDIVNFVSSPEKSFVVSGFVLNADPTEPTWNTETRMTTSSTIRFLRLAMAGEYIDKSVSITLPWNSYIILKQLT